MKRTILVTGANRGIGEAIVRGLSEQKSVDTILLGARVLDDGESKAQELGNGVKAVHLDLSKRVVLKEQLEAIQREYGALDVLINNSGLLKEEGPFELTEADFDQVMRVNLFGAYELSKALLPQMIKNNYGRIVNMSSGWGSMSDGLSGPFSYSLSKAALNALTLTLSRQVSGNIKINSMCPGWVHTRMGGSEAPRTPEKGAETALWLANLDESGPNGKFFRDREEIPW